SLVPWCAAPRFFLPALGDRRYCPFPWHAPTLALKRHDGRTSMRREPPMMNPVDRCQVAARAARVLLSSAMLVLVPAIAAAAAPDHFACYKAAYAPNA